MILWCRFFGVQRVVKVNSAVILQKGNFTEEATGKEYKLDEYYFLSRFLPAKRSPADNQAILRLPPG